MGMELKKNMGNAYVLIFLLGLSIIGLSATGTTTIKLNASSDEDAQGGKCDASYPDVCIASPPPDLNCDDITDKNFKVVPPDPHGFDREGDGTGCET
jgi:hypothetical protein